MPKSRTRTKRGKRKFQSHADTKKINEAYARKFDEFDKLEVEELKELQQSKTVKGTYAVALKQVIDMKMFKPKEKAA